MSLSIGHIEAVDRFGLLRASAHDRQGLSSTMKFLEIDIFSRHQTASRFGRITQELGRHTPLSWAELHEQATHHLGRELVEQTHPIIGRHLFHELKDFARAEPFQQALLNGWFKVFVDLNRFIFSEQSERKCLHRLR